MRESERGVEIEESVVGCVRVSVAEEPGGRLG